MVAWRDRAGSQLLNEDKHLFSEALSVPPDAPLFLQLTGRVQTDGSHQRLEQKLRAMSDSDTCRVKVVCRVRPLNEREHANGSVFVVGFPSETSVALKVNINN